ncbi:MerC domain-containing protein [Flavobacterium sp.]|uniref:MerC domain-containing protein n=1 Tax=Flavobacterium sp. TaxID=239 RepID=UPI0037515AD7
MKLKPTSILDILGISSATICLAHCLIFPLLTILPIGFIQNYWLVVAFACIGMFIVSKIILSNTTKKIKIILGFSILLVIIGVILEIILNNDLCLILIGGIGMITEHLLNFNNQKHH